MNYHGRLFGRCEGTYFPLEYGTKQVEDLEAELAQLRTELAEALVLLAASHESTAEVARDTKYRHMDDCSICAFLARQEAQHE